MLWLLPLAVLVCAGCSGRQIRFINYKQSFIANAEYGGENFTCNVQSGQTVLIKITSPEKVKGLTFTFGDNKARMDYKGISFCPEYSQQTLTFASIINAAFCKAHKKTGNFDGENYVFKVKADKEDVTLYCDRNGIPKSIVCPREELTVQLKKCEAEKQ